MKHTQGNWTYKNISPIQSDDCWDIDCNGSRICVIEIKNDLNNEDERSSFAEEMKANAKLIAAAPELLEALKDACERMDRARDILKERHGYWGMLDTSNLIPAIEKATK